MKFLKPLAIILLAIILINVEARETKVRVKKAGETIVLFSGEIDSLGVDTIYVPFWEFESELTLNIETITSGADSMNFISNFYKSNYSSITKSELYFSDTVIDGNLVNIYDKQDWASSNLNIVVTNLADTANYELIIRAVYEK